MKARHQKVSSTSESNTETSSKSETRPQKKSTLKTSLLARYKVSFIVILVGIATFLLVHHVDLRTSSGTNTNSTNSTSTNTTQVGGWRLASPITLQLYDPGLCHIPRVSVYDLPPSRFEEEFRFKQPVLVTFPEGAQGWTWPSYWTREELVKVYQDSTVRSGQSLNIVRKGGNADHSSSFLTFVEKLISKDESDSGEPLHYAFDRDFYRKSRLPQTLSLPPYFEVNTTTDESIFFLGASRTGVVFHKHSDTWNGVVFGRKRWFLYPSSKTPPGGVHHGFTLLEWVNRVYPKLEPEDKPMECVQEAGEILYLPEGTYHATLNLGDTVAVAIQKINATLPGEVLSYEATDLNNRVQRVNDSDMERELHLSLLKVYENIHQLFPKNSEAITKIGYYKLKLGEYAESISYSMEAIKLDPYFILAYYNLGRALTSMKEYDRAETIFQKALELSPNLWDGYKEYGEFLIKRGRFKDALPIMKKGTEMRPDLVPFWLYYKHCQQETGDEEGAKLTEEFMELVKAENKLRNR